EYPAPVAKRINVNVIRPIPPPRIPCILAETRSNGVEPARYLRNDRRTGKGVEMTTTTERNRKSPADYLASEMTENQKEFLAYVLQAATEAGLAPQSAPEIRFFEIGV